MVDGSQAWYLHPVITVAALSLSKARARIRTNHPILPRILTRQPCLKQTRLQTQRALTSLRASPRASKTGECEASPELERAKAEANVSQARAVSEPGQLKASASAKASCKAYVQVESGGSEQRWRWGWSWNRKQQGRSARCSAASCTHAYASITISVCVVKCCCCFSSGRRAAAQPTAKSSPFVRNLWLLRRGRKVYFWKPKRSHCCSVWS